MNKIFLFSLIIINFCFISFSSSSIKVFFSDPPSNSKIDKEIIKFIDSAKTSIDCSFYQVNHEGIVDAFIRASKRIGKDNIRWVNESSYYNKHNYKKYFEKLENAGIKIITDDADGVDHGLCHNKFCIVDRKKVWSGSTNITTNGMYKHNNNSFIINSKELAEIYRKEFEEMYVSKKFSIKKTDNTKHFLTIDNKPAEIYFSPTDNARERLIELIKTADHSIHFAIFTFSDKDIRDAILERWRAGVKIIGVYDAFQAHQKYCTIHYLKEKGIKTLITDANKGLCHHKFMVIDANTNSNPLVFTGSLNFTGNGDSYNDENSMVFYDPSIATKYANEVMKLYIQAGGMNSTAKVDLIISKVSLNSNNGDWIEIYCKNDNNNGKGTSLRNYYIEVDHELFSFNNDFSCKTGDRIIIADNDSTITSSSNVQVYKTKVKLVATDEQVSIIDKRDHLITDSVCWSNNDGKIITSEIEDIDQIVSSKNWIGSTENDFVNVKNLKKDYILTRDEFFTDTNTKNDWIITNEANPGVLFNLQNSNSYLFPSDIILKNEFSILNNSSNIKELIFTLEHFKNIIDNCFSNSELDHIFKILKLIRENKNLKLNYLTYILDIIKNNIEIIEYLKNTTSEIEKIKNIVETIELDLNN